MIVQVRHTPEPADGSIRNGIRNTGLSAGLRLRRGFTLIEILVAVVVISVIITVGVISIDDPGPARLREESRRLAALAGLVQEEAILQSRDFGVAFWQQGYAFYEYSGGKWLKVDQDRTLRTHPLPPGAQLQLVLEGIDVVMSPTEPDEPQVFILSSGEMSPFRVRLKFSDKPAFFTELSADALGTLEQTDSEQLEDAKFKPAKRR